MSWAPSAGSTTEWCWANALSPALPVGPVTETVQILPAAGESRGGAADFTGLFRTTGHQGPRDRR
ncbi:hypothetical protein ACFT0G_32930, partial [Streptomyces sp. NPDC057020]